MDDWDNFGKRSPLISAAPSVRSEPCAASKPASEAYFIPAVESEYGSRFSEPVARSKASSQTSISSPSMNSRMPSVAPPSEAPVPSAYSAFRRNESKAGFKPLPPQPEEDDANASESFSESLRSRSTSQQSSAKQSSRQPSRTAASSVSGPQPAGTGFHSLASRQPSAAPGKAPPSSSRRSSAASSVKSERPGGPSPSAHGSHAAPKQSGGQRTPSASGSVAPSARSGPAGAGAGSAHVDSPSARAVPAVALPPAGPPPPPATAPETVESYLRQLYGGDVTSRVQAAQVRTQMAPVLLCAGTGPARRGRTASHHADAAVRLLLRRAWARCRCSCGRARRPTRCAWRWSAALWAAWRTCWPRTRSWPCRCVCVCGGV
jgi:hypothetical protein